MPIASQVPGSDVRPTTVPTVSRAITHTPVPGPEPVNTLGPETGDVYHVHHTKQKVVVVEPRVGSMDNLHHVPGGGNVEIFEERLQFKKKARSRIGSLENIHHHPGGGHVKIINKPTHFRERAHSKVGSLENIHHIPGGGYTLHRDDTSYTTETSTLPPITQHSGRNSVDAAAQRAYQQMWSYYEPGAKRSSVVSAASSRPALDVDVRSTLSKSSRRKSVPSKIGSLENIHHRPGGGQKKIFDEKVPAAVKFRNVGSKVGSLENITYAPPPSEVQIVDVPLRWRANSKVGSLENIHHVPLGGHVAIIDEPVVYKSKTEVARAAH